MASSQAPAHTNAAPCPGTLAFSSRDASLLRYVEPGSYELYVEFFNAQGGERLKLQYRGPDTLEVWTLVCSTNCVALEPMRKPEPLSSLPLLPF